MRKRDFLRGALSGFFPARKPRPVHEAGVPRWLYQYYRRHQTVGGPPTPHGRALTKRRARRARRPHRQRVFDPVRGFSCWSEPRP